MPRNKKERRLTAVMFTDIVGYTALMQKDEQKAATQREKHRRVITETHERYGGTILQYFGDGTLSTFASGVEAVACAVAIQEVLNQPEGIPLRIGIHVGDIVFDGTDIYGDGVNVASRIESMGVAGGILISGRLNDELANQQQLTTTALGHFQLKNIQRPLAVYAVANPGLTIPQRQELRGKRSVSTQTVAVLPFLNRSSNEDNEYLCDGMTEEIINALSKLNPLKVTSRTSSFFYKHKQVPLAEIAHQLQVAYVLEGSIQFAGKKMRISVNLVDVQEDVPLWSKTLDRKIDDIFAIQDEVSLMVADQLREHIGHFDIEDQLVPQLPVSADNYKRYLKGRYHILKMNAAEIERGISILRQITVDEPSFPLAYLGLHLGYTLLGTLGLMPVIEAFSTGKSFLNQAEALDDSLPEIQLHLSYNSFIQNWELPAAYEHLRKSFAARPSVEYYQSMASYLVAEGKLRAAHNYIDTALQIDPFSDINYHLKGYLFYVQEQYAAAIRHFEKSLSLKPDSHVSFPELGRSLLLAGHHERAREFFRELPLPEDDPLKISGETMYYALTEPAKAQAGLQQLEAALEDERIDQALGLLTLCYAMLGHTEQTLELLERGIEAKIPMVIYTQIDPVLKPIKGLAAFQNLRQRIFGDDVPIEAPGNKYKKNLFSPREIDRYKQKLRQLMEQEHPFLDPELSLRSLADRMDMPPNYLSQLLNAGFEQNFAEYVNNYRLGEFKKRLIDPNNQHLTLLALAYDSGFNSKTSFNTFFKKATGTTPANYRKQVVGQ